MDFSIGNLVSGVIGAVAKVGNAVVDTAKSIISGISEIFSSVVSGAMAALGVVDVDEDGDIDFDDAEELLEEKFKLFVGASVQGVKNLASHPIDTLFATAGTVLGVIGVAGSGILEIYTAGTASPAAITVAAFSANSVVSSSSDLIDIASGNYEKQGSFNPLKSGAELVGETFGKGVDKLAGSKGYNETGKNVGGLVFEGTDFFFGAKGVKDASKIIFDKTYKFKEVISIGDKIIPEISVAVNNVSKAEKIGAATDASNTVANWVKNFISNDDQEEK